MSDKLEQLLRELHDIVPTQHLHLLQQLADEIDRITPNPSPSKDTLLPGTPSIDTKTGCYRLDNSTAHYCPSCYETDHQLIKTQRLNSKLRVCPHCRASIKPQIKDNTST